jgi:hypothetical protein
MAANRLARLSVGLLVAALAFTVAPALQSNAAPAHGSAAPAAASPALVIQDRSHDNDNPDEQLYALFQILNNGTTAVPLSSLTMRYWLTDQAPSDPLVFACDWAQVNCSNITAKFVTLATPIAGKANTYLQISFTAAAGSIAPGQTSGEIQTRIHHANYSLFDTSLTYSFISDPSFVYKNTQTVTLYQNGTLVWGTEPS